MCRLWGMCAKLEFSAWILGAETGGQSGSKPPSLTGKRGSPEVGSLPAPPSGFSFPFTFWLFRKVFRTSCRCLCPTLLIFSKVFTTLSYGPHVLEFNSLIFHHCWPCPALVYDSHGLPWPLSGPHRLSSLPLALYVQATSHACSNGYIPCCGPGSCFCLHPVTLTLCPAV